jgi:hypothetical protein
MNLAEYTDTPAVGDSKSPAESPQVGWKPTALCSPFQWTSSRLSQGIHSLAAGPDDCHHIVRDSAMRLLLDRLQAAHHQEKVKPYL